MIFEISDQTTEDGYHIIRITEGKFEGISFSFGKVEFKENNDDPVLSFQYDLYEGELPLDSKDEFEDTLGNILHGLIVEQLENNEIVYGGGIDEN